MVGVNVRRNRKLDQCRVKMSARPGGISLKEARIPHHRGRFRDGEPNRNALGNRFATFGVFERRTKLPEPGVIEMKPREQAKLVMRIPQLHRECQAASKRGLRSYT